MKTYKSKMPQITLKLIKGEVFNVQIKKSKDAADMFSQLWDNDIIEITESAICIFLNRANNTIGWLKISQGGLSGTVIDVRLILSVALNCLASGILLCHNHPSGNIQPSESDIKLTTKIKEAGEIMDIQLIDHIILSPNNDYYSFADNALI